MKNHGDRPTIVVESNADAVPVIDQVDILRFRIGYPCPACNATQIRYIDQLGKKHRCTGCGNDHELPNAIMVTAPGPLCPVEAEPVVAAECEHRRQHWNMQGGGHCDDCGAPVGTSVTAAELVFDAEHFLTGGTATMSELQPGEVPVILSEGEEYTVVPEGSELIAELTKFIGQLMPNPTGPDTPVDFGLLSEALTAAKLYLNRKNRRDFKLDEITPACLEYAQAARKAWGCTENDGFAIEMAYQFGATVIDDDCELLAITTENMVNLMAALGFEHREPSGLRCAGCPPDHEPAAVLNDPVSDPPVAGCSCSACTSRFGNWPKGD